MPGWDDILKELGHEPSPHDVVRRKYIKKLSNVTGRNVIAYYSAWLTRRGESNLDIDINDADMTGFMNSIKGMDCSKGLDLVLHTPGGSPTAAEAIVKYLRTKFNNDIRVIVPQLAMSAGTMIACASKEIIMGKQSSLGPIDPQFNGIPAYNIRMEFEEAKADLAKNPANAHFWRIRLQQYPAAFLMNAIDAIALSDTLIGEWLGTCMYDKNDPAQQNVIKNICENLNEHDKSKNHGRHFDYQFCKDIGLKIVEMETDPKLQDAILSMHHAYMLTLSGTNATKVIESQNGKAYIRNVPRK